MAQDQINLLSLSTNTSLGDVSELSLSAYLPDAVDCMNLRDNYAVLLSRVLVDEIDYFKKVFGDCVYRHIPHEYSSQMKEKSTIVSSLCCIKSCSSLCCFIFVGSFRN